MKRVVIIQARTTSTRLPGKVLMDLGGRPMLVQQLRRLARCQRVDDIVVATTVNGSDDPVTALADAAGIRWFRGSEHDVLSRYVGAAREVAADIIVRVTADCPLIDPGETDRVIAELEAHVGECDYASNILRRTFPRGLDTEALCRDTLERTARLANQAEFREHVTLFIYQGRPDLFLMRSVTDAQDNSDLRWTVDTNDDLTLVRRLYAELHLNDHVLPYRQILEHVRRKPPTSPNAT